MAKAHIVELSSREVEALSVWLKKPNGAHCTPRATFEAVEGGGILVRTRSYEDREYGEPKTKIAHVCKTECYRVVIRGEGVFPVATVAGDETATVSTTHTVQFAAELGSRQLTELVSLIGTRIVGVELNKTNENSRNNSCNQTGIG